MKKISVFSVLLTKTLFLGCISFMGVFNGTTFAENIPCHEVVVQKDVPASEGCDTCVTAEDVWSQSFVSVTKAEVLEIKDLLVVSAIFFENFSKEIVFIQDLSAPDPPDGFRNTWLEAKETIVLVI